MIDHLHLFIWRKMRFYNIKDSYIEYLRSYDAAVALNKKETRPYVGVVLEIDGIHYYAPFTSPKQKHKKMKNGKDFRKINNGEYGAINFNNMIPVLDSQVILIDIENIPDLKYRRLLQNQYKSIKADIEGIQRTAEKLHKLVMAEDDELSTYDRIVKSRCCNLRLLEKVYANYVPKMLG
ncbi:MAG: type III toxin-antitoxin system ToxN/AbiQ family toxin [Lachnospiraceae bacterium]|nr:type III toxin-antitoxin system ToxN/AbiQ family toxin [Lachnospiraceae bacterium]